jgi:hypothetical protein
MGWYIFDSNGYVGDLASNRGLIEMRENLSGKSGVIDDFFENGCSEELKTLATELQNVKLPRNKDIAETITNLASLVGKCDTIAIISDGFESSNDPDKKGYLKEEIPRIKKLYSPRKHKDFKSRDNFVNWFEEQIEKQEYACYYCGTSIFNIEKLIDQGKLETRKAGKGGTRGRKLEVDRMNNKKGYKKNNCVLACYYCNNDKSYIFDSADYKKHFGKNRNKYFSDLLLNKSG